jgi:cytochrome bd-type quinol oxidase subunit 1
MKTSNGVTPLLSASWVWISLIAFVLVYIALGAVDAVLMIRYGRKGLAEETVPADKDEPLPLAALTY